jgi:cellulose synthase/poly-beta-1,6-N-acetylglucosamine synthase-like glycosyltransferase
MQWFWLWFPPLLVINLALWPYLLYLLTTALAAMIPRRVPATKEAPATRFLIIIPAHDEETGVAETVRSCREMDYPPELFEVCVIADNCTDETARVAREAGATVVERFDQTQKSKGYAIEYLLDQLRASGQYSRLDAVVVIDADSTASPGLLRAFASRIEGGVDFLQCWYTVSNPEDSWRTRLMTYAFSLFNGVTPLGHYRLGGSAGFRGNGMGFTTRGLDRVPWKSYGLVEDMEYSWSVRIAGETIAFVPEEKVYGVMLGGGGEAAAKQRQRWEFGRREVRRRILGPILRSEHLTLLEKLACALELTIPTTMRLAAFSMLTLALDLTAVLFLFLQPSVPHAGSPDFVGICLLLASSLFITVTFAIQALSPFLVFRLPWSYLGTLAYVPFYAAWKLVIARKGRPDQWVRTAREQTVNR